MKFDFLGFTFRPRQVKSRQGIYFVSFSPAISDKAAKEIRQTMRSWKVDCHNAKPLEEVASWCNPMLRGWINYYGRFRRSALHAVFKPLDEALVRWARRKYKRLSAHWSRAENWLRGIAARQPLLFAHWQLGAKVAQG